MGRYYPAVPIQYKGESEALSGTLSGHNKPKEYCLIFLSNFRERKKYTKISGKYNVIRLYFLNIKDN